MIKKSDSQTQFIQRISKQISRKVRAQNKQDSIWFGFGMFGLIGWSVALPLVLGVWLGLWLDKRYQGGHLWTLVFLVAGLCIGCWNASRWVLKEHKDIQDEETKNE